MASISTSIAAITKDDSFAMRTIAIMTIVFLPATAISSLFSTSMFDWQAAAGSPVVSIRFCIYLTIAIPLTFLVFGLWLLWISEHKKHEKNHTSPEPISELEVDADTKQDKARKESSLLGRMPRSWRRVEEKQRDQEEGTTVVDRSRHFSTARSSSFDRQRRVARADTFIQGPMW